MKVQSKKISLEYAKGFKNGVDLLKQAIKAGVAKGNAEEAINSIVIASHTSSIVVKEIQENAIENLLDPIVQDFVEMLNDALNNIKCQGINPPNSIELKLELGQED